MKECKKDCECKADCARLQNEIAEIAEINRQLDEENRRLREDAELWRIGWNQGLISIDTARLINQQRLK